MTHSGTFQVLVTSFSDSPFSKFIFFHTMVPLRFVVVLPDRPHNHVSVWRFFSDLKTFENSRNYA